MDFLPEQLRYSTTKCRRFQSWVHCRPSHDVRYCVYIISRGAQENENHYVTFQRLSVSASTLFSTIFEFDVKLKMLSKPPEPHPANELSPFRAFCVSPPCRYEEIPELSSVHILSLVTIISNWSQHLQEWEKKRAILKEPSSLEPPLGFRALACHH